MKTKEDNNRRSILAARVPHQLHRSLLHLAGR